MSEKVILVFARLDYSHSDKVANTAEQGVTTTLLGVAGDLVKALAMINIDKYKTLIDEGMNPVLYDFKDRTIHCHGGEYKALSITITGIEGNASWTNVVSWYTQEVPVNELLDHFEL